MSLFALLLMLSVIGIIRGRPDSSLGRTLRLHLVEKPVDAALRLRRHHIIWFGLVSIAILLLMAIAASKVAMTFETTDFLFAYSLDLSLYLDAVLVASTVAAATHVRTVMGLVRARSQQWTGRLRPMRKGLRRPRARRHRTVARRPEHDDGPFALALAA